MPGAWTCQQEKPRARAHGLAHGDAHRPIHGNGPNPRAIAGTTAALAIDMIGAAGYEIDCRWRIIEANEEFSRAFQHGDARLIGRDIRDLVRNDWRMDFRKYVA